MLLQFEKWQDCSGSASTDRRPACQRLCCSGLCAPCQAALYTAAPGRQPGTNVMPWDDSRQHGQHTRSHPTSCSFRRCSSTPSTYMRSPWFAYPPPAVRPAASCRLRALIASAWLLRIVFAASSLHPMQGCLQCIEQQAGLGCVVVMWTTALKQRRTAAAPAEDGLFRPCKGQTSYRTSGGARPPASAPAGGPGRTGARSRAASAAPGPAQSRCRRPTAALRRRKLVNWIGYPLEYQWAERCTAGKLANQARR